MPTKRDVSNTKKKAVINAWRGKCAISGFDMFPLHVDHIVPLVHNGSNEFSNLVPLTAAINLNKGGNRFSSVLEQYLLFQAAAKEPDCLREYAKLSHKANPLPSDPSKVELTEIVKYLRPSSNWTIRELKTLVTCYIKYGTNRIVRLVGLIGKTLASARMKLVWLGIYNKNYSGLVTV